MLAPVRKFADVFADSRLVGPRKSFCANAQDLEARVGIEPTKAPSDAKNAYFWAFVNRYSSLLATTFNY
jgi:hypothetical protein